MQKSRIAIAFDGTANPNVKFTPPKDIYSTLGIRRKRFAQLYRGEKSPLTDELKAIAKFTGVPVVDLLE